MTAPLDWTHTVAHIGPQGLEEERRATPAELTTLAECLDIENVLSASAKYEVRRIGREKFRLSGVVVADLIRTCIVTLDPLPEHVTEDFAVEFWPQNQIVAPVSEENPILDAPEIEPIPHGVLDVGRIVYEVLSSALDPYPRKADAAFSGYATDKTAAADQTGSFAKPFQDLRKLIDRS